MFRRFTIEVPVVGKGIVMLTVVTFAQAASPTIAREVRNSPSTSAAGGPTYSVIRLDFPGNEGWEAPSNVLNNNGEVVATEPSDDAFLWLPEPAYGLSAGLHELIVVDETYPTSAYGINDAGVVVGKVHVPVAGGGPDDHAYHWTNGAVTDLGASLGGMETRATGLNELGQIIGGLYLGAGGGISPILWLPNAAYGLDSGPNFLSEQPGVEFSAFLTDINESGAIVGSNAYESVNGAGEPTERAFIWLPVSMYGLPQGVTEFGRGQAMAVNDSGEIVGFRRLTPYEPTAFKWQNGTISNLPKLQPSDISKALDVNNSGQIVGYSQARAVLWESGQVIDLNNRVSHNAVLVDAHAINDLGQILCVGIEEEQWGVYLLTPSNVLIDCNQNGISDSTDLANGTSEDCNADQLPDECQQDCNNNGFHDTCDVVTGMAPDCNGNGVPDSCDIAEGTSADQCGNQIPDECDEDCNLNGIPDACEIEMGTGWDCNLNYVPDECELAADQCEDAKIVCPGTSYAGTLAGATQDGGHNCASFIGADVWFKYIPSVNGVLTVTRCASNLTADLSLHSACPPSPANQLACAGSGTPDPSCNGGYRAQLQRNVTAGNTYLIGISDFLAAGDFNLALTGPPCESDPRDCDLAAAARGCRYIEVAASTTAGPVALLVMGDLQDPRVACVHHYVQGNGTLGQTPLFQAPEDWGRVDVHDEVIIPQAMYSIREYDGVSLSSPVSVSTWKFGDVDNNSQVNFVDIAAVVSRFRGVVDAPSREYCDMDPELPDGLVNFADIAVDVDAFRGRPYRFDPPCP